MSTWRESYQGHLVHGVASCVCLCVCVCVCVCVSLCLRMRACGVGLFTCSSLPYAAHEDAPHTTPVPSFSLFSYKKGHLWALLTKTISMETRIPISPLQQPRAILKGSPSQHLPELQSAKSHAESRRRLLQLRYVSRIWTAALM